MPAWDSQAFLHLSGRSCTEQTPQTAPRMRSNLGCSHQMYIWLKKSPKQSIAWEKMNQPKFKNVKVFISSTAEMHHSSQHTIDLKSEFRRWFCTTTIFSPFFTTRAPFLTEYSKHKFMHLYSYSGLRRRSHCDTEIKSTLQMYSSSAGGHHQLQQTFNGRWMS